MRERILSLSGRTEVLLVLLLAFGVTVPHSLRALLSPEFLANRAPPITNEALHRSVLYELGIMAILIPFLRARGWTRERLGIRPTVQDSLWGVGILLGYYLAFVVLVTVVTNVWPQAVLAASRIQLNRGPFDWQSITAVSLVNPVFEEVFVCGYLITALRVRFGTTAAVNVSAGIRLPKWCSRFYRSPNAVTLRRKMARWWWTRKDTVLSENRADLPNYLEVI